jgi:hypothetical protein
MGYKLEAARVQCTAPHVISDSLRPAPIYTECKPPNNKEGVHDMTWV